MCIRDRFYNAGHMNDHFRALVPVVVGDYEPPEEYKQFVNLSGEEELIHQNTQEMCIRDRCICT